MKKLFLIAVATVALTACKKSIEDRAAEEARTYTEKYCPTPVYNYTRTDSLVFDRSSRTFIYYCALTDRMDDPQVLSEHGETLRQGLLQSIKESTTLKLFKDHQFGFRYVIHSAKDPSKVLFDATFAPEEYQ